MPLCPSQIPYGQVYNNNNIIIINNIVLILLIVEKKHWYEPVINSAETIQRGKITILWNQRVQTDRTIPNNKPDIIIRDTEQTTCMLIDVAIFGDGNVIKKEAEKILRYKYRTT